MLLDSCQPTICRTLTCTDHDQAIQRFPWPSCNKQLYRSSNVWLPSPTARDVFRRIPGVMTLWLPSTWDTWLRQRPLFALANSRFLSTRYRTIMSYSCGTPYIFYFSNPDVSYLGKPTGTATENNARSIRNNMVRRTHTYI